MAPPALVQGKQYSTPTGNSSHHFIKGSSGLVPCQIAMGQYRVGAEHSTGIAALDVRACSGQQRMLLVVWCPFPGTGMSAHSLDTADVDAVVFTSGVSAATVRHDCPARSTHCDDRVVSADADIVINSSVGRWLLLVLKNIVSPLHLPLLSHGSYRLLGA